MKHILFYIKRDNERRRIYQCHSACKKSVILTLSTVISSMLRIQPVSRYYSILQVNFLFCLGLTVIISTGYQRTYDCRVTLQRYFNLSLW